MLKGSIRGYDMQQRVNNNMARTFIPVTTFMFFLAAVMWGVIFLNRFFASEPVSSDALSNASFCAKELLAQHISAGTEILRHDLDNAEKACRFKERLIDKKTS